jgi:hypothetical protein
MHSSKPSKSLKTSSPTLNLEIIMTRTAQTAAYKAAMNSRSIVTFGRSFIASLAEGKLHRDAGKLSAFLVATKASTAKRIQMAAAAGDLTLVKLNEMARAALASTKVEDLPKNFRVNA